MKRILFAAALMMFAFVVGRAELMALPVTPTISRDGSPVVQKITITGIVPEMRLIYVDPMDHIQKVVGNTASNITPQVVLATDNKKLPMSPYINEQYQRLLDEHGGKLQAGQTYRPQPYPFSVRSTHKANHPGISPDLSALKLSFS